MDIPGEHAAVIPIRVYEGHSDAAQLPVFVYYHGGGFAIGGREMKNFHILCNKIAALGFVVVAVSYRLAPEHPFPAAIEDGAWQKGAAGSGRG
jgi:acetyl esterase